MDLDSILKTIKQKWHSYNFEQYGQIDSNIPASLYKLLFLIV